MTAFLLRRLLAGLLVLWTVATLVFVLFYVTPADPGRTLCGTRCSPAQVESLNQRLGFGDPVLVQYGRFLGRLAQGDLGHSVRYDQPVAERIVHAVGPTLSLVLGAAVLWLLLGVGAGLLAARRPGGWADRAVTVGALTTMSVPSFVVGMVLLYLFFSWPASRGMAALPPGGYVPFGDDPVDWARHLLLPWVALAIVAAGVYARVTRSTVLAVRQEDFVRTARAKGLSERRVVLHHVLPAAAPAVVTLAALDLGTLLGGAVVIEKIFALQGLGQEAISALGGDDLPMILGLVLVGTTFVVVFNTVADVLHAWMDPRVGLT